MATYTPGETVRVLWPAKNHQADTCTNPYIPDTTMKLYVTCGSESNPTVSTFTQSSNLVIDWKNEGNKKGFQNCPFFCDSPDKAICYQDFTVPSNLPSGSVCSFLWYWVFNEGTDAYTTCWEARIAGSSATTSSPTNAPVTKSPTSAAVTGSPTNAAVTGSPTKAPSSGSTTSAPVNSGSCSAYSLTGDSVYIKRAPTTLVSGTAFNVDIQYSSSSVTGSKTLVVEIFDNNFNLYATGKADIGSYSSGTSTITMTINRYIAVDTQLRISAVIVQTAAFSSSPSDLRKFELSRFSRNAGMGSSVVYGDY